MKILGFDTSTKFLSLGAYDGVKTYEYTIDLGTKHSALLVPTVKRVLDALGWSMDKIDYFACGQGPGSFTGLRVGIAALKAMSWAFKKPVIGVSTLDILASAVTAEDAKIASIIDARRSLTYCGFYWKKGPIIKRAGPYMLLSEEELFKRIENSSIIVGDGITLHKEKLVSRIRGVSILDKDYWYPKGHCLMKLALEKIKEKKFYDSFNIKPIYLYPKECQIRRR